VKTRKALYDTVDYLIDDDFINHVILGTPYSKQACCGDAYLEARSILLASEDVKTDFSFAELLGLKNRVLSSVGFMA
jgi:hypothetical protein